MITPHAFLPTESIPAVTLVTHCCPRQLFSRLPRRAHIEIENESGGGAAPEAVVHAYHFEDALATCRRSVPQNTPSYTAAGSAPVSADNPSAGSVDRERIDQVHRQWVKQLATTAAGSAQSDQTLYIAALENALHTAAIDLPTV